LAGAKEFFAVDDRIDVPATAVLEDVFLAGGTVSAWVRPDTFGGTSRGRIADKTAGVAGGWMFYLSDDAGGEVRFRQGYGGGQVIWRSQRDTIVADSWFHVVATFDVSNDAAPRMYVNGVEQTVALSGAAPSGMPVSDVGLDVVIGNSDVVDRWFDGRIDELRLERTVRSPAWIEMQYRSMTDTLVAFSSPERREDAR
ncbi:MAG TPA: LamG domain-containing protein, partial [Nannocystaceae bacterium]|nr:LamG domain-containing protein [Nannocystaceae bacterium]